MRSNTKSRDASLLQDEELRAIVATPRDYALGLATHAHGVEGMKRAIRAGVDSIEHGTRLNDEAMVRLMKQHGTYLVPDPHRRALHRRQGQDPGLLPRSCVPRRGDRARRIAGHLRSAYKAGVKIAFGTDCGVCPTATTRRSSSYMVEGGMPPLKAIQAATIDAATVMGWQDEPGDDRAVASSPTS